MIIFFVLGVEVMCINVVGLFCINKIEVQIGYGWYLEGIDIFLNGLGVFQKVGEFGVIGISLMFVDFGDIFVMIIDQLGGIGLMFLFSFFNLGIGYVYIFENKIFVGVFFCGVLEFIVDVNVFGFVFDVGVQYVIGENDNFKFGIVFCNIGGCMQYGGEGFIIQGFFFNNGGYELMFNQCVVDFELFFMLNIGLFYDFLIIGGMYWIIVLGNFIFNFFFQDQVGGGIEYLFKDFFMVWGGYCYEFGVGDVDIFDDLIYIGLSVGVIIVVLLGKDILESWVLCFVIDYVYWIICVWNGIYNIGVCILI